MGGGSWPRGGKERKTRPDIARRRERQRDWESCNRTRKRKILRSDTHWPSRRPCTDARRTETTCVKPTCVAPRYMDAPRDFLFSYFLIFSERPARGREGGGGGRCQTFPFFFFPCSADHERDWPLCKVIFSGWQPTR